MPPCVVQLGRYGDILNILPLIETMSMAEKPVLVVSQKFRDIAESVTYCDFRVFPGEFHEHRAALESLKGKFSNIITPQVYGDGISFQTVAESFCAESYARAGYIESFQRGQFDRINIDKRHTADEDALAKATIPDNGLPTILLNLVGYSSPFIFGKVFKSRIENQVFGRANVIDLATVRAKRFTDLLGLYDRAALLVTSDTGTLHLAGAHEIPYIAFITDRPSIWHGAYTRGNCLARLRYGNSPMWAKTVEQVVESAVTKSVPAGRRMMHVYSRHQSDDPETNRRHRVARQSWNLNNCLAQWWRCPINDEDLPRLFNEPNRKLPFIKDLLDRAIEKGFLRDDDLLVLTNTDTCFGADLSELLLARPLVVGRRRDFHRLNDLLSPNEVRRGDAYVGADLFAMPVSWWKQHRDEMPDMVVGREAWDAVLAQLMLRYGAEETWDYVYHERHLSTWDRPENKYHLPGQLHNLRLAYSHLKAWDIDPARFGIRAI